MRQLPLILENRRLLGREDFLVSSSNLEAVEWIDAYPDWINIGLLVIGDKCSGKTHLSWLFSEKSNAKIYNADEIKGEFFSDIVPLRGALVIDDIDNIVGDASGEELLVHIINYAAQCGVKLFFTTKKLVGEMQFVFDDLKTRLLTFGVAQIYAPDDDFLKSLLVKQFIERGIFLQPDVIDFIVKNIPRDAMSVKYLVERSDELSFNEKCKITIPFLKKIIDSFVG